MPRLVVVFLLLCLPACTTANQTASNEVAAQLAGRWAMETILENGEDVTAQHNPADNRWVAFVPDGTFVSDGDPHGRNTGRWTLDAATNELYLDSDTGEGDDSYWIVEIRGDEMHWQGTRSAFTERFAIVHTRD